jgi:AcrR family transcriptional regulator
MTPAEASAARRRRARKGEGDQLRDEILTAAAELLLATGSEEEVSIRAVADAVGVTPPSIYRHFEDKAQLLYSVCLASYGGLADDIEAAVVDGDPMATLRAQARAYVRYGVDHPEHYRLMFMTQEDKAPVDLLEQMTEPGSAFALLLSTVEDLIDAGLVRPGLADHGAAAVGTHLWSVVHGITALLITKPALPWGDLDAVVDQQLDLVEHGIRADG